MEKALRRIFHRGLFVSCILWITLGSAVYADDLVVVTGGIHDISSVTPFAVLKKETDLAQVTRMPFASAKSGYSGFTSETVWVKVLLKNATQTNTLLLISENAATNRIDLFREVDGALIYQSSSGRDVPFALRPSHFLYFAFPIQLDIGSTSTYYLRYQSKNLLDAPLRIATQEAYRDAMEREDLFLLYFGFIFAIALFNFSLFLGTRELSLLYYAAYLLLTNFTQMGWTGLINTETFEPAFGWIGRFLEELDLLSFLFCLFFTKSFLDLQNSIWGWLLSVVIWLVGLLLFLSLATPWFEYFPRQLILPSVLSVCVIGPGVWALLQRRSYAVFYLIAWSGLAFFVIVGSMSWAGFLADPFWRVHTVQVGILFDTSFLTLAVMFKIRSIRIDRVRLISDLQLVNQAYRENQILVEEAKSVALQERMNPHFLFNALNTVHGLIFRNATRAQVAIELLADVYRYTMNSSQQLLVPISWELEFLRNYVEFAGIRFNTVELKTVLSGKVERIMVPPLLIQPMVENCFKHAFTDSLEQGAIVVRVKCWKDGVAIRVSDNGRGSAVLEGETVRNIRERLGLLFGKVRVHLRTMKSSGGLRATVVFFDRRDKQA